MRYLYHQGGRNHGPVRFEQLKQLAEEGTIDNMTPVLAEGAAAWSRWLFIKEQPPTAQKPAAPEPAKESQTPKAVAPKPGKPATPARPATPAATAPAKKKTPAAAANPAPTAKGAPVAAGNAGDKAPASATNSAPAAQHSAASSRGRLLSYLPALIAVPVLGLCLGAALVWQLEVHDLQAQTEQRAAYARQQAEQRPELGSLQQQLQEQEAQKAQLAEELAGNTAKLTELKQELAKLGSPGSGTGELDAKITQLRDKIKELDKQTAELSK
ncbi:MAG: DUF4339 domain-containing protein [Akkermansia sp.]